VDKEPEDDDQEDHGRNLKFQDTSKVFNVIFGGDEDFGSRRDQKLLLREILSVEPAVPRPLRWSEVPISFSRDDQWTSFSELGKFPLVLDPVVAEVKLTKVLIDGGIGLNLISVSTLKKMGLDFKDMLVPSKSPFYGIVPGIAAHPLGTVVLPVTFGTRENYRTEFIKFEVANFESSYHAILGRLALAKFVAVPHYVYLLLEEVVRLQSGGDPICFNYSHARCFGRSTRGRAAAFPVRAGDSLQEGQQVEHPVD
jgi:hypothetical protein